LHDGDGEGRECGVDGILELGFKFFKNLKTYLLMPSLLTRRHTHVYVRGGVLQRGTGQLGRGQEC